MTRVIRFLCVLLFSLGLASGASALGISLSLNLDFADGSDFGSGGTWTVVAKVDGRGIAGIVLRLQDPTLNFNPASGFLTPAGFEIETSTTLGSRLETLQADDLSDPTLDVGVVGGIHPSTYVDDPLLQIFGANTDLGSFTGGVELITGSFDPGMIPAWFDDGSDRTLGNLFVDAAGSLDGPFEAMTTVRYLGAPEPGTIGLLGVALAWVGRTRRRSQARRR